MACVLLIDDDENVVQLLSETFELSGYSVITCSTGQDALEMAKVCKPDAVIIDVMMPNVDGFQVLWHLKNRAGFEDVPTIMLTSCSRQKDINYGLYLGAEAYLTKPFSANEVLNCVVNLQNVH